LFDIELSRTSPKINYTHAINLYFLCIYRTEGRDNQDYLRFAYGNILNIGYANAAKTNITDFYYTFIGLS